MRCDHPSPRGLDDARNCREACQLLRALRHHGPMLLVDDRQTRLAAITLFAAGMIEVDLLPGRRFRIRLPHHKPAAG